MSRTAAIASLTVVRGSTWEDEFTYTDADGVPVDLTGYEARMQVRTPAGQYGSSTDDTLVLELLTTGASPQLVWDVATGGRLLIRVAAEDTLALNPDNAKKVKLAYGVELFIPAGTEPEYVVPLAQGSISVKGEVVR